MSLRTVLQAIGLLAVGWVLFWGLFAMGPLGWVVFGTMLVVGVLQVHRERSRRNRDRNGAACCANCGATVDLEAFDTDGEERTKWEVNHCSNCGAPVQSTTDDESRSTTRNCPDCGAPNEPSDGTCAYCDAAL